MKRLVRFKLNFQSKFLTLSGVMMGFAFFFQALEFFALRSIHSVDIWSILLLLILPMVLEALWCVSFRVEAWNRAEVHGVFAALICLILLGQSIMAGGLFNILMGAIFCVVCGAAAILITWGWIPHRALGMLVFSATAVARVLIFALPAYISAPNYMTLVQQLPPICMILAMMLFFGGLYKADCE